MMKAVEFETTVSGNGQILLPQEVMGDLPPGEPVRVVLMWEASFADEAWRKVGRRTFEDAYCAEDAVYDELVANDVPDR